MADSSMVLNAELWSSYGPAEWVTNAFACICSSFLLLDTVVAIVIYNTIEIVFYNKEITSKYLQCFSQTTLP